MQLVARHIAVLTFSGLQSLPLILDPRWAQITQILLRDKMKASRVQLILYDHNNALTYWEVHVGGDVCFSLRDVYVFLRLRFCHLRYKICY
jgi:hypothetical protein